MAKYRIVNKRVNVRAPSKQVRNKDGSLSVKEGRAFKFGEIASSEDFNNDAALIALLLKQGHMAEVKEEPAAAKPAKPKEGGAT